MLRILITAALALLLHLTLGWAWTLLAGVIGGVWARRWGRAMLVGAIGVGLDWAVLVGYNLIVAGAETRIMTGIMGALIGNTPGAVVVAATVLIGALIGALGGWMGSQLHQLARATIPRPA